MEQQELPMFMPYPFRRRVRPLMRFGLWLIDLDLKTTLISSAFFLAIVTFPTFVFQPLSTRWRAIAAERSCQDMYYDKLASRWTEPFLCEIDYVDSNGNAQSLSIQLNRAPEVIWAAKTVQEARSHGRRIPALQDFYTPLKRFDSQRDL